jgi:hypothetical protein
MPPILQITRAKANQHATEPSAVTDQQKVLTEGGKKKKKNRRLASPHAIGSVLQVAPTPFARPARLPGLPWAERLLFYA